MRRSFSKIEKISAEWKRNVDHKGRYDNHHAQHRGGLKPITKWGLKIKHLLRNRKKEMWQDNSVYVSSLDINIPYHLIWLGHSSFYLNLNGVKILIDPVFGQIPFVKRIVDLPIDPVLFTDIDYILISHDHYDHLDKRSIRTILAQSSNTKIICGAGTETMLSKFRKVNSYDILPMEWYDKYQNNNIAITFLPSVHWSRRSLTDSRKRLWGAFMIECCGINIYFSGDTNYGTHFRELSAIYPRIDYAIIGIGAFRPRTHLYRNHISPREAIRAAIDMRAHTLIPMHYNTFDLSSERYFEPLHIFRRAAEVHNVNTLSPAIGEVLALKVP